MNSRHVLSGGRYPVLRALAIIYVIGAGLAAISTVLTIGYILFGPRFAWTDKLIMVVGALAAGFFLVISMLAIAEVLKLFIDMEHNTRMGAVNRMSMPAGMPTADAATSGDTAAVGRDGGRMNSFHALDEETAEAALLRGH
ncbi:MAG TPA: hypothetical protein VER17_08265 [Tepidisphaeraceae bacterium]|nr:hypothetical protein [Tepidisphaeraceae bacterium]